MNKKVGIIIIVIKFLASSSLLQILIKQEQGQTDVLVVVQQAFEVVAVSRQLADRVRLLVDELLLEERRDLRVVEPGAPASHLGVDLMGVDGQLLLRVEGSSQAAQLVHLERAGGLHRGLVLVEVHLAAALRHVLDQVDGVAPRVVGQLAVQLFETGAALLKVSEVGRLQNRG